MEATATIVKDWVDFVGVGASVATAIFAGFAVLIYLSLRNLAKAQLEATQAESLLNFLQRWENDSLLTARQRVSALNSQTLAEAVVEADKANSEDYFTLMRVADFFEDLGYASKVGYVKKEDIWEELSAPIDFYYGLYQKVIENMRERKPEKRYKKAYQNFQALRERLDRGET